MIIILNVSKFTMLSNKAAYYIQYSLTFILVAVYTSLADRKKVQNTVYLKTRIDGKLFSPSRSKARIKVKHYDKKLFAVDAAVAAHSLSKFQS